MKYLLFTSTSTHKNKQNYLSGCIAERTNIRTMMSSDCSAIGKTGLSSATSQTKPWHLSLSYNSCCLKNIIRKNIKNSNIIEQLKIK